MPINVLEYLENAAEKYPDKTAFADSASHITYRELLSHVKAAGSMLCAMTKGMTKRPVMVLIDRNISSLTAFLGAVYSGNFYVPTDRLMPRKRLEVLVKTLEPVAVIAAEQDASVMEEIGYNGPVLSFEQITGDADEEPLKHVRKAAIDTDPLYAIFTSGSTGVPKGVLVCHRSVIDLIERFTEVFDFSEKSVFGNQAPFDFDVSVKDIYSTLKNGATLYVIPKVCFSFPIKLIEFLNSNRINTGIWAASVLRIAANLKALESQKPEHLQTVMFSGEVTPNKVLNYWRRNLPDVKYVNLYGPTEITCNCTYYVVDRRFEDHEALPIGIPFPNTDIMLLDDSDKPAENGGTGEICVRGTSLALGYYNNPERTAAAFSQNPLNSHYPELIYRTGDLGRYNERGELMFLSRKDNQIKHMGHRIELGEVETAVNALPFIDAACCIYDAEREKIVLFYQSGTQCDSEILLGIRERLFKYMQPNRLVHFEHLPLNKNAKIDRVELARIYKEQY